MSTSQFLRADELGRRLRDIVIFNILSLERESRQPIPPAICSKWDGCFSPNGIVDIKASDAGGLKFVDVGNVVNWATIRYPCFCHSVLPPESWNDDNLFGQEVAKPQTPAGFNTVEMRRRDFSLFGHKFIFLVGACTYCKKTYMSIIEG